MSRSNSSARYVKSRTRLWVQKNEAMREPRVIGVTLCRLVPGLTIASPAASFRMAAVLGPPQRDAAE